MERVIKILLCKCITQLSNISTPYTLIMTHAMDVVQNLNRTLNA